MQLNCKFKSVKKTFLQQEWKPILKIIFRLLDEKYAKKIKILHVSQLYNAQSWVLLW